MLSREVPDLFVRDHLAYGRGFEAYKRGDDWTSNPFLPRNQFIPFAVSLTVETEWQRGWDEARAMDQMGELG